MTADEAKKEFMYEYDKMVEEEVNDILKYAKKMKYRTTYDEAREEAEGLVNSWITYAKEDYKLDITNLDSLIKFVGSHRRPKIWATLIGMKGTWPKG